MSTNITTCKPNKYLASLVESDGWKSVIASIAKDQITIGTHGKNKEDNAKYLEFLGIGKVGIYENNGDTFDLLVSQINLKKDCSAHEKDDLMFEIGQIANFWSFVCVSKKHPLFEGLVEEDKNSKGFSWYLI
jgi:hypothetical protein